MLIDIVQGKLNEEEFLSKPNTEYYYSDAHLGELLEARGNPKVSQEGRLDLISRLCGQKCILNDPEFFQKDVEEMYRIVDTPLRSAINAMAIKGGNIYEKVRIELGFESRQFNNEPPEMVLEIIDERMQEKLGIGLIPYLLSTEAFGGKVLYYTLLNIIDTANYWGDIKTNHSDVTRLYDASYAYSAMICYALVTSDKRMMAKVKEIYSRLNVSAKVLSVKEFLSGGH